MAWCRSRATHWKQTVFYLDDTLIVNPGDQIHVNLHSSPNDKNPRDLDIEIEYCLENSEGSWSGKQEFKLRWHIHINGLKRTCNSLEFNFSNQISPLMLSLHWPGYHHHDVVPPCMRHTMLTSLNTKFGWQCSCSVLIRSLIRSHMGRMSKEEKDNLPQNLGRCAKLHSKQFLRFYMRYMHAFCLL